MFHFAKLIFSIVVSVSIIFHFIMDRGSLLNIASPPYLASNMKIKVSAKLLISDFHMKKKT